MSSDEYFKRRAVEREKNWYRRATKRLDEEVSVYFKKSLDAILRDIAALYAKYADENGLSLTEARKLIRGDEFQVWRMTLEEYIAAAKFDSAILKELNTLAMRRRINRLEALHARTLMELADLCERLNQFEDAFQYRAYVANYYGTLYDIHREIGLHTPPVAVDSEQVKKVIRTAWVGANYSARIWRNTERLAVELKSTMERAVHRGDSIQKLSKNLARRMEVGYNNAERLVRTELNFVQNKAALDSITDAGLDCYRFVSALDNRTCPRCGGLDGQVFEVTESMPGENFPPMHPRCRCTIVPTLGEQTGKRTSKVAGKREKVPQSMTYTEWKKVYVDGLAKFEKVKYDKAAKVRPLEEFLSMAKELKPVAEKYSGRKSLWSGKSILAEKSAKNWNCDIWLWNDSPKHVLLHEMIHSCSCSYYSPDIFTAYKFEEELVVQYLCQEISRKEDIEIISGGYDNGVELLRKIKETLHLNIGDLEFARDLINQPLGNRWKYLEELTINAPAVEDYLKALKQIEVLKKWKVQQKDS